MKRYQEWYHQDVHEDTKPRELKRYQEWHHRDVHEDTKPWGLEWFLLQDHPDDYEDTTNPTMPALITELFPQSPSKLDDNTTFQTLGTRTKIEVDLFEARGPYILAEKIGKLYIMLSWSKTLIATCN